MTIRTRRARRTLPRAASALVAIALATGCGKLVSDDRGGADNATGASALPDASTSGSTEAGATDAQRVVDAAGTAAIVCNGVACAPGFDCCRADGHCFDPATPSACARPDAGADPQGHPACNASSQCAANEVCLRTGTRLCIGGDFYCTAATNCGSSAGVQLCGCDGVTYADIQTACALGVPIAGDGRCGDPQTISGLHVVFCGNDAQCPSGQTCCGITGRCYDPALPALCRVPPPGTSMPCIDDSQCMDFEYCYADGCGTPGGCVQRANQSQCDGVLSPVCGCNGTTYTNAACAAYAGQRVAHTGACP